MQDGMVRPVLVDPEEGSVSKPSSAGGRPEKCALQKCQACVWGRSVGAFETLQHRESRPVDVQLEDFPASKTPALRRRSIERAVCVEQPRQGAGAVPEGEVLQ